MHRRFIGTAHILFQIIQLNVMYRVSLKFEVKRESLFIKLLNLLMIYKFHIYTYNRRFRVRPPQRLSIRKKLFGQVGFFKTSRRSMGRRIGFLYQGTKTGG